MLIVFSATLLLAAQPGCIGYGAEGSLEDQFDRCLAGTWGEEGCTAGRTIAHSGYENAAGEACAIGYFIRDPHTGGFRVGSTCGDAAEEVAVWIVEDGQLKIGNEVGGFPTVAWRCEEGADE